MSGDRFICKLLFRLSGLALPREEKDMKRQREREISCVPIWFVRTALSLSLEAPLAEKFKNRQESWFLHAYFPSVERRVF